MSATVPFVESSVEAYLDHAIRRWREIRVDAAAMDRSGLIASCYVDAYQSVRVSLFGKVLAMDEPQ